MVQEQSKKTRYITKIKETGFLPCYKKFYNYARRSQNTLFERRYSENVNKIEQDKIGRKVPKHVGKRTTKIIEKTQKEHVQQRTKMYLTNLIRNV